MLHWQWRNFRFSLLNLWQKSEWKGRRLIFLTLKFLLFLPFSSSKIEIFGWHTVRLKKERRKCNKKVIFCTAFLYTECLIRTIILLLIFFSALIGLLKASKMEFSVVWYGRWWKGEQRVPKVFFFSFFLSREEKKVNWCRMRVERKFLGWDEWLYRHNKKYVKNHIIQI